MVRTPGATVGIGIGDAPPVPGHPEAAFTGAEIFQKLAANAEGLAGKDRVERIAAALRGFRTPGNARDLTALLAFDVTKARMTPAARGPGRPDTHPPGRARPRFGTTRRICPACRMPSRCCACAPSTT